jgi:hypothetical protein
MSVEPFAMRDLDATQEQFPPLDQLMNIVTDADMIHLRAQSERKRNAEGRRKGEVKHQAPTSKHQRNTKSQTPNIIRLRGATA